jgi:hypothetical protein
MNSFIQTISELLLDREEFLRIYSPMNKNIKFIEFFSTLLGSISLAVSAILINPPYSIFLVICITSPIILSPSNSTN